MSHMSLESTSIVKRGPSVRLSFLISCRKDYSGDIQSDTYCIGDDLAQFYLEFVYSKSGGTISPRIYSSTTTMRRNSSIIMSVKCKNPKIFNEWVCGSEWTHLSLMPVQISSGYTDKIFYKFKIIVTVNEKKNEPLHAHIYEDEHFTDFYLVGDNGNVAMHKVVLAASSPVFKATLLGTEATIELPEITQETLQHLKEFMYLGILPDKEFEPLQKETTEAAIEVPGITRETIQYLKDFMYLGILPDKELEPLLLLAKYYMMDNLKTKCIKKLTDTITCDNIYTSLEFACENNLPELATEILHFTSPYPEIAENAYVNKTANPIQTSQGIQSNETGKRK